MCLIARTPADELLPAALRPPTALQPPTAPNVQSHWP